MKVIDLLNKIANGEEVPKVIELNGTKYKYINDNCKNYSNELEYLFSVIDGSMLNDEIEIVEGPKKIEKMIIPSISFNLGFIDTNDKEVVIKEMNKTIQDLYDRTLTLNTQINKIIDYINKGE